MEAELEDSLYQEKVVNRETSIVKRETKSYQIMNLNTNSKKELFVSRFTIHDYVSTSTSAPRSFKPIFFLDKKPSPYFTPILFPKTLALDVKNSMNSGLER